MGKEPKNVHKKAVEVKIGEPKVIAPASDRKKAFEALIKAYKKQNPRKYEMKREALKEQLKNIK